jgi:hypothetical protein
MLYCIQQKYQHETLSPLIFIRNSFESNGHFYEYTQRSRCIDVPMAQRTLGKQSFLPLTNRSYLE